MDRAVDPCTDFYRYSCGSWIKNNPIPPDQARWNVYSKLATENQRFLWGILEQAAKPSPARTPVETEIGDYFYACMDEAAREKSGAAPLRPELDKVAALKSLNDLATFLAQHTSHHRRKSNPVRLLLRPGLHRFQPRHRLPRRRRTGTARPRLLHQDRRQVGRDPRALRRTHPKNAGASRRVRRASQDRRADRHEHRNRASQSVAHSRRTARSAQALPSLHASETAGAHPLVPLENLFREQCNSTAFLRSTSPSPPFTPKSKRNSKPAASTIGRPTCAGT